MIEPIHPRECGELDGLEVPPRPLSLNHLRLEETDDRFGHSVVVEIAAAPDRRRDAGAGEPIGIAHGQVLRAAIAVMHQAGRAGAAAIVNGFLKRNEDEVGRQRRGHAPPDKAAREDIDDERDVNEARATSRCR